LQWASVVLNLGVHALHMIRERDFQIPRVPKSVSPEFFSALVRVMAEDQRHSGRRWNDAERPAGIGPEMEKVMRENTIAQMVCSTSCTARSLLMTHRFRYLHTIFLSVYNEVISLLYHMHCHRF
jgi:hypothetical protein